MWSIEKQLSESKEKREMVIESHLRGFKGLSDQYVKGERFNHNRIGFRNYMYDMFNSDYMRQAKSILFELDLPLLEKFEREFSGLLMA